jgi:hypothetical protein
MGISTFRGGIQLLRSALITAITIAILSFPGESRAQPAGAPEFVSLEGRFSISLSDRFKQQTKRKMPTPLGDAYGNLYEWQIKEVTFGVGYADTFQPIKQPEAVKQLFDSVTESFTKLAVANNGNVAPVKQITLDNHPGIEHRADISKSSFIQRTYLVSRRIYQTLIVMTNSKRDESNAIRMLDSFKLLSDAKITEEALKVGPGPLPQTPEAPRAGSDAGDENLRGPVKSVRTKIQYPSEGTKYSLTTYNEKGNKLRTESYDLKNNLELITVYGYLDGSRVSASKFIQREYSPPFVTTGRRSNRDGDPRYQWRFEFKYDEKKRLTEKTDFLNNGDLSQRYVYKYEGNQKEQSVYLEDGSLSFRSLSVFDGQGNVIEETDFTRDGAVTAKRSYTYEFDPNGNWTKRTISWKVVSERLRRMPPNVLLRTIAYY